MNDQINQNPSLSVEILSNTLSSSLSNTLSTTLPTSLSSYQSINLTINQTIDETVEIINANLNCDLDNKVDISEHYIYLGFNCLFVFGFLLPTNKIYLIYLHLILTIAYLLQCIWSWQNVCGSNLFTWSVTFLILNSFNTIKLLIQKKEVTFSLGLLNDAYSIIFESMGVTKNQVKKLFSPEMTKIICLENGEAYAIENQSKTDKLSLLLSGRIIVTSGTNLLHVIEPMQFLDSPEWLSCKTTDEKFRVTILAETECKILCWQKSTLHYFLGKETFLAQIFTIILSNDISNKLFTMNEKVLIENGNFLDIRKALFLPSISDKILADKSDEESYESTQNSIKLTNEKQNKR